LVLAFAITALGVLWPTDASAQYYRGHHVYVRGGVYYGAPYYYRPYYYPYWGWYGLGFGFGYPYAWGPYPYYGYPYYYGAYDYTGAARLEVKPREAQVYVDGYFVGLVDDFDGTFQRLNLEPGEHELQLYLEGYRTVRQRVLFRSGTTLKITLAMQPLGPGETSDKPVPDPGRQAAQPYPGRADRMPPPQGAPPQNRGPVPVDRGDRNVDPEATFGTLALRVQPGDAEVLIDGERWDSPEGGSRLLVQLSEGSHRVEVRKEGFRTYSATVNVRRGMTETLNVSLGQGGSPGPSAGGR
jgi:hypothetical protein